MVHESKRKLNQLELRRIKVQDIKDRYVRGEINFTKAADKIDFNDDSLRVNTKTVD